MADKLALILRDVEGTLLRALGNVERRGYDYRDVHCTQRPDGDFDLRIEIENVGGPDSLRTLCKQLNRLHNVEEAHIVDRPERRKRRDS